MDSEARLREPVGGTLYMEQERPTRPPLPAVSNANKA